MVRFKNRHLLVEFLQPSSLSPSFSTTHISRPTIIQDEEEEMNNADEEVLHRQPDIPFLLPLPEASGQQVKLRLGDESGGAIYKAIRGVVQDVFGDEGWGRIASSFKVIYHSPLTTLTIIRIARPHYRLLWSSITLLTSVNGQSVLPRVVAVSGTIKKLQNAAIVYHRNVTARVLAVALNGPLGPSELEETKKKLEIGWDKERNQISTLED